MISPNLNFPLLSDQERRPDQVVFALNLMNHRQLPMVTEFIDPIIHHTPQSPANAKQLVSLYERCQQNSIKVCFTVIKLISYLSISNKFHKINRLFSLLSFR